MATRQDVETAARKTWSSSIALRRRGLSLLKKEGPRNPAARRLHLEMAGRNDQRVIERRYRPATVSCSQADPLRPAPGPTCPTLGDVQVRGRCCDRNPRRVMRR